MEKRLIDANALDKTLVQEYIMYNDINTMLTLKGVQIFNAAIDVARSRISDAPTIETVPVVRCGECVFRGCTDLCPMCWRVSAMDEMRVIDITEDDGFCYKGAKIDLEED